MGLRGGCSCFAGVCFAAVRESQRFIADVHASFFESCCVVVYCDEKNHEKKITYSLVYISNRKDGHRRRASPKDKRMHVLTLEGDRTYHLHMYLEERTR